MAVLNLTWFRAHLPPSRGRGDKLWALPPKEGRYFENVFDKHIKKAYNKSILRRCLLCVPL
jgi:hypothetical protein